MIYLGNIEPKKETDYSYWNPPIETEYGEVGTGISTPPLQISKYNAMWTSQLEVGASDYKAYIYSNQQIYSFPAGSLPISSTLELDLAATYGTTGNIVKAVGHKNGESRIAIVSSASLNEQLFIFSNDGNFTLLNNVANPSGNNEGLESIQWDENTEHFYANNRLSTTSMELIKIDPDGNVVGIIVNSPLIDSCLDNCFSFIDSSTAWVTTRSVNTGDWTIIKLDLNTFTFVGGSQVNVKNTTIGNVDLDGFNSSQIIYSQYIASQNKILLIAQGDNDSGDADKVLLIFDVITETTNWNGEYYFQNKQLLAFAYDRPTETVFMGVGNVSINDTYTISTATSNFVFTNNDIEPVLGKGAFKGYLIDDFFRTIYIWKV